MNVLSDTFHENDNVGRQLKGRLLLKNTMLKKGFFKNSEKRIASVVHNREAAGLSSDRAEFAETVFQILFVLLLKEDTLFSQKDSN